MDLAPLEQWCELTAWPSTAIDERLERLRDAEIAITNKIPLDGELLRQLPKLRLICVAAPAPIRLTMPPARNWASTCTMPAATAALQWCRSPGP